MTYMWYISPVTSNHAQKRAIQKGFRGTVINKYIDGTDNHKQVVVAGGSDTSEFFTEVYEIDLYKYIKAGDSIVKLAGDSSLFVIRNNSRKRFRIEDW